MELAVRRSFGAKNKVRSQRVWTGLVTKTCRNSSLPTIVKKFTNLPRKPIQVEQTLQEAPFSLAEKGKKGETSNVCTFSARLTPLRWRSSSGGWRWGSCTSDKRCTEQFPTIWHWVGRGPTCISKVITDLAGAIKSRLFLSSSGLSRSVVSFRRTNCPSELFTTLKLQNKWQNEPELHTQQYSDLLLLKLYSCDRFGWVLFLKVTNWQVAN